MTEEKSQFEAVGGDRASQKSGANGEPAKSAPPEASVDSSASSGGSSFPASAASGPPKSVGSSEENAINKELRRLNRALRALSACNQALAQAGSEQELLQQICDVIVHLGGYRMAFIAYAQQDEEKTVRPMANAGHGERRNVCSLACGRVRAKICGCHNVAAAACGLSVRRAGDLFGAGGIL